MWIIVILVLAVVCYITWQYFSSGDALSDAYRGIDPVEGCKARLWGCGCLAVIALLVLGYIYSKFQ